MNTVISRGHPDDYVHAVRVNWLPVLGGCVLGVLISLGGTTLLKPLYEVRTTVLFAQQSGSADLAAALGTAQSPVGVLKGVATSLRVRREIAKRTGIPLRETEGCVEVRAVVESNQLRISGIHGSRETAMLIASVTIDELNKVQREVGLSIGSRQLAQLDKAINIREEERVAAMKKLVAYQESAKTMTDPTKLGEATFYAKVLSQVEFDLESAERQISTQQADSARLKRNSASVESWMGANPLLERTLKAEIDYRSLQRTLGPDNPKLLAAETTYRQLEKSLQREIQSRLAAVAEGLDPEFTKLVAKRDFLKWQRGRWRMLADEAPLEAVKFARLTEELAAKEQIVAALRKRREESKLSAEVDRFRWSVLEKPELMPEPVNKNWFQNGLLGLLIGAILGAGVSVYLAERKR